MRTVVDVRADEVTLLFEGWVAVCVACPGFIGIVIVVAPFCEMVGKFKAGGVGGCILEINDYELFVVVCGEEKWRGGWVAAVLAWFWCFRCNKTEDVAILRLDYVSCAIHARKEGLTSL